MRLTGDNGQLFGWAESTWQCLDQIGILTGDIMMVLTLLGGVIAWLRRDSIRRWLSVNRFPVSGKPIPEDEHWDALVFTISRQDVPNWVIQQRSPQAIGLIATHASHNEAGAVAAQAALKGIQVSGPKLLDDPDDPAEAQEEVRRLIQRLRADGYQRIGIDITGGKTPMSLGAFMAAQEQGCDTLYVTAEYDARLRKPDTRSAVIRCITRAENS